MGDPAGVLMSLPGNLLEYIVGRASRKMLDQIKLKVWSTKLVAPSSMRSKSASAIARLFASCRCREAKTQVALANSEPLSILDNIETNDHRYAEHRGANSIDIVHATGL